MMAQLNFVHVQGQTFMVIGAAGELPKPPSTPIQFLEGASSRFDYSQNYPYTCSHRHGRHFARTSCT